MGQFEYATLVCLGMSLAYGSSFQIQTNTQTVLEQLCTLRDLFDDSDSVDSVPPIPMIPNPMCMSAVHDYYTQSEQWFDFIMMYLFLGVAFGFTIFDVYRKVKASQQGNSNGPNNTNATNVVNNKEWELLQS
jgi:hypothetical protein